MGTVIVVLSKIRSKKSIYGLDFSDVVWITEHGSIHDFGDDPVCYVDTVGDPIAVERAAALFVAKDRDAVIFHPFEFGGVAAAFARQALGRPGLDLAQVMAFSDKWTMKQMFKRLGLSCAEAKLLASPEMAKKFLSKHGSLVIKPRYGGGSSGVRVITKVPEIEDYPCYAEVPVHIAREFHVDTVVAEGEPRSIVSQDAEPMLDSVRSQRGYASRMLPPECYLALQLKNMVHELVGAVGVSNAVFHTELFETSTGEIIFSESAIRPGGGGIVEAIELATGENIGRAHFAACTGAPIPARTWGDHMLVAHVALPLDGVKPENFESLPGVELRLRPTTVKGEFLSTSNGGFVFITADTEEELIRRYVQVQELVAKERACF